jgi:hypothetical protein
MRIQHVMATLSVASLVLMAGCSTDTTPASPTTQPKAQNLSRTSDLVVHLSNDGVRSITNMTRSSGLASDLLSSVNMADNVRRDELRAKLAAFVNKGPIALILVDHLLPDGAIAEVHLNSTGPITRFMVIPRSGLNDEVIDRAYSLARNHEMQNPDDVKPVIYKLGADGNYVRVSNAGEERGRQTLQAFYSNSKKDRRSRWLLKSAERVAVTQVEGVGRGRVMSLGVKP